MIVLYALGSMFLIFIIGCLNLLRNPNDWRVVWTKVGRWTITYAFRGGETEERCVYEILYSSSRKKYKLKLSGYTPKENKIYEEAVKKLNELNESLNNKYPTMS